MLDPVKKALLSLLGGLPLTSEETRKLAEELVSQGILTQEQGERLSQALLERGRRESGEISEKFTRELKRLSGLMPLVSRGELKRLEERLRRVEERLGLAQEGPPQAPDVVEGGPEEARDLREDG